MSNIIEAGRAKMAERMFQVERDRERGRFILSFKWPERIVTSSTKGHFRTAVRETLLTFRGLIDDAISLIKEEEES